MIASFFAIPGLRLGFAAIFDNLLKNKIYKIKEPWTINSLSAAAGVNIFNDAEYIEKTKQIVKEEKDFLYGELKKIKEIKVFKSFANFFLVKLLNGMTADILTERLINDKILIRNASNFKFLTNEYFRIAVKNRVDNLFLLNKLKLRITN